MEMFDIILRELHPILERHNIGGSVPIHPEKQLLVFLNFMGNQQSMTECAHFFGLSISTVIDRYIFCRYIYLIKYQQQTLQIQ